MAKARKQQKTLADYLVIAVSPALIMALVGSLVYFLLEVTYKGMYPARMMWVLGWFVFGAVLIARIAIQEGREHALPFGFTLAGATALFAARYVDAVVIMLVLLAVVWWCASKLTRDCTLIDDSQDASGEGLLQTAGLETDAKPAADQVPEEESLKDSPRRPHSPGLWVVYFSLAALPLFGVGQLLIPSADGTRRAYGFQLLAVYVASALGLLLATSFLGLRRYLRQRNLQMPATMAFSWLFNGIVIVIGLLILALLLPQPQGEYTLTTLVDRAEQKLLQASRMAQLGGEHGEGTGRPLGKEATEDSRSEATQIKEQARETGNASGGRKEGGQSKSDQQGSGKSESSTSNEDSQRTQQSQGKDSPGSENSGKDKQGGSGKQGEDNRQNRQGESSGKSPQDRNPSDSHSNSENKAANKTEQNPSPGKQVQPGEQSGSNEQTRSSDQARSGDQSRQQSDGQNASSAKGQETPSPDGEKFSAPRSRWGKILGWITPIFKWLVYGALAILGVWLFILYNEQIFQFLSQLWLAFTSLFHRPSTTGETHDENAPPVHELPPFAAFDNPFRSGAHLRLSPAAVIVYSFDALEAWSRERVMQRGAEQTPLEFATALSRRQPDLAREIRQTANLYVHVAYGSNIPGRESLAVLESLWMGLERAPAQRQSG